MMTGFHFPPIVLPTWQISGLRWCAGSEEECRILTKFRESCERFASGNTALHSPPGALAGRVNMDTIAPYIGMLRSCLLGPRLELSMYLDKFLIYLDLLRTTLSTWETPQRCPPPPPGVPPLAPCPSPCTLVLAQKFLHVLPARPLSHWKETTESLLEALASLPPSSADRFLFIALATLSCTFLVTRRNSGADSQALVCDRDSGRLH